jgi:hypothetical protein
MPLDISDAQSSFLYGRAEFNKWADRFMTRWLMPDIIMFMQMAVKNTGVQGLIDNPEAVLKTESLVNKLTGRE